MSGHLADPPNLTSWPRLRENGSRSKQEVLSHYLRALRSRQGEFSSLRLGSCNMWVKNRLTLKMGLPGYGEMDDATCPSPPGFILTNPHLAMGERKNKYQSPRGHPNPTTKIGSLKWVVNSPSPKMVGVDPRPYGQIPHEFLLSGAHVRREHPNPH